MLKETNESSHIFWVSDVHYYNFYFFCRIFIMQYFWLKIYTYILIASFFLKVCLFCSVSSFFKSHWVLWSRYWRNLYWWSYQLRYYTVVLRYSFLNTLRIALQESILGIRNTGIHFISNIKVDIRYSQNINSMDCILYKYKKQNNHIMYIKLTNIISKNTYLLERQ